MPHIQTKLIEAIRKFEKAEKERERIEKLSELGSPRSLTYVAATLLLAATGKVETERNRILWTAGEVLPIPGPIHVENSDKCWRQLVDETARLWNMLVMGGRR